VTARFWQSRAGSNEGKGMRSVTVLLLDLKLPKVDGLQVLQQINPMRSCA